MSHRADYGAAALSALSVTGRYPVPQSGVEVPQPGVELSLLKPMLDQRLPASHELFLIAVDDRTGGLRLHPDALALGLAGAVLGELVLFRYLTVSGGRLVFLRHDAPADAVLAARFKRLLKDPHIDEVSTWLRFFADDVITETANQLESRGWLRMEQRRRLLRFTTVYRPSDNGKVAWRAIRAASVLTGLDEYLRAEPVPWHEVLLFGLLDTIGLLDEVLWNSPRDQCKRVLNWCLSSDHGPLRSLLHEVAAAHADVVRTRLT